MQDLQETDWDCSPLFLLKNSEIRGSSGTVTDQKGDMGKGKWVWEEKKHTLVGELASQVWIHNTKRVDHVYWITSLVKHVTCLIKEAALSCWCFLKNARKARHHVLVLSMIARVRARMNVSNFCRSTRPGRIFCKWLLWLTYSVSCHSWQIRVVFTIKPPQNVGVFSLWVFFRCCLNSSIWTWPPKCALFQMLLNM